MRARSSALSSIRQFHSSRSPSARARSSPTKRETPPRRRRSPPERRRRRHRRLRRAISPLAGLWTALRFARLGPDAADVGEIAQQRRVVQLQHHFAFCPLEREASPGGRGALGQGARGWAALRGIGRAAKQNRERAAAVNPGLPSASTPAANAAGFGAPPRKANAWARVVRATSASWWRQFSTACSARPERGNAHRQRSATSGRRRA